MTERTDVAGGAGRDGVSRTSPDREGAGDVCARDRDASPVRESTDE
jgi:hypothetical protein